MDTPNLHKPSSQALGLSALLVGVLGLIGGAWYYQEHNATRTQRLRRRANRQLRRVRNPFRDDHLSSSTGMVAGILGVVVALLFGGGVAYRRSHRR